MPYYKSTRARPRYALLEEIHKVTQKDINGKINSVFSYSKNVVDFEAFLQEHFIKHTPAQFYQQKKTK